MADPASTESFTSGASLHVQDGTRVCIPLGDIAKLDKKYIIAKYLKIFFRFFKRNTPHLGFTPYYIIYKENYTLLYI
jgi:hypothetical protein